MKKKLFSALSILLICVMALFAFVVIVKKSNSDVVFMGGKSVIWVLTGSMEGVIPEKSYILVSEVKDVENEVKEGSIITFYSADPDILGKLNTHKVIEVDTENRCFITQGVNNPTKDAYPVPYENVIGVYVRNMPVLTALGRFFMTPAGLICSMVLIIGVATAMYLPEFLKRDKQKEPAPTNHDEEIERLIAEEVERLKQQNKNNEHL